MKTNLNFKILCSIVLIIVLMVINTAAEQTEDTVILDRGKYL